MSFAIPLPDPSKIDRMVAAFADLLDTDRLAVVCRFQPTGDTIGVNTYDNPLGAMLAVWANDTETVKAEVVPTAPLTVAEENAK